MTPTHLHTVSPWVIDTRAIGLDKHAGPGLSAPVQITAPAPANTAGGVLAVPTDRQVVVEGLLESVAEGVVATGTAAATALGACSRCLEDLELPITARFQEMYAYPDSATAETTDADEVARIADETIDLEPLVHDELVLAMPTVPVCSPDCPGLCPDCGARMDSVGPDHRHETIDPRWAALAGFFEDETTTDSTHTGPSAGGTKEK